MSKKTLVAIAFLMGRLLAIGAGNAPVSDANLTGHVIDAENGEHIPGCVVRLADTDIATMTDASGHYVFRDLVPGEYTVTVSFMGYATESRKVTVKSKRPRN